MSKIDVKSVGDKDLSPDDLQAQIDASVNSAVSKPEAKKDSPESEPEQKAEPVAKVAVGKKAPVEKESKPTEPTVVSHRGKVLNPADARKDEPVEGAESKQEPVEETKPTVKVETVEVPKDEPVEESKPQEPEPESEPVEEKIGEISEEIKQREAEKEAAKEAQKAETQQPQIVDTKQYHLPIKSSKRGSGSGKGTLILFILIAVIVGAYIAADMEVYDPGFELPYDLF